MTAVLIHASGIGNPDGARNWRSTIESPVDFRGTAFVGALSAEERKVLGDLHGQGRAQFWGTHRYYENQMARLAAGDVVIFTGLGKVLGMGRVGFLTDNPALGDRLWQRHVKHGSYRHVYSLAPLTLREMSQVEFRQRGGFSAHDDFRGLRLIEGPRAAEILAEFADEIPAPTAAAPTAAAPTPAAPTPAAASPLESALADARGYEAADQRVAADLSTVRELDIEIRSIGDTRVAPRASASMHRGENLLVHAYAASLGTGARWCRYTTPAGVTDLDVFAGGRHELIEAKSNSGRMYVRQALAQLLDYAPALGPKKPDRLAALFPLPPEVSAIEYLHRYGVACIFREPEGRFFRRDAPAMARIAVSDLW